MSTIKFGGYDREALFNYTDFHSFKTIDIKSWKIHAKEFEMEGFKF